MTPTEILQRPLTVDEVEVRPGPGGRKLTYVAHHTVVERLIEAFGGQYFWEIQDVTLLDASKGRFMVQGKLTSALGAVCGVAIAEDSRDLDKAVKSADTDALKRAARLLGVGLELYDPKCPLHDQVKGGKNQAPNRRGSTGLASDAQVSKIFGVAREKNLSRDKLLAGCKRDYRTTPEKLTRAEASEMIEKLMKMKVQANV